MGTVEERRRRGRRGDGRDAGRRRGRLVAARPGEDGWRLGMLPTRGSHLSARGRERRGGGALVGRCGPKVGGPAALGLFVFYFVCFLFFFKSISNIFQTFLNQNFYIFSNSNFNTNFSNYFKGFSQTIFNNFSNIF
jgi:hypothetical protein